MFVDRCTNTVQALLQDQCHTHTHTHNIEIGMESIIITCFNPCNILTCRI